jgi:hypothetical protein
MPYRLVIGVSPSAVAKTETLSTSLSSIPPQHGGFMIGRLDGEDPNFGSDERRHGNGVRAVADTVVDDGPT